MIRFLIFSLFFLPFQAHCSDGAEELTNIYQKVNAFSSKENWTDAYEQLQSQLEKIIPGFQSEYLHSYPDFQQYDEIMNKDSKRCLEYFSVTHRWFKEYIEGLAEHVCTDAEIKSVSLEGLRKIQNLRKIAGNILEKSFFKVCVQEKLDYSTLFMLRKESLKLAQLFFGIESFLYAKSAQYRQKFSHLDFPPYGLYHGKKSDDFQFIRKQFGEDDQFIMYLNVNKIPMRFILDTGWGRTPSVSEEMARIAGVKYLEGTCKSHLFTMEYEFKQCEIQHLGNPVLKNFSCKVQANSHKRMEVYDIDCILSDRSLTGHLCFIGDLGILSNDLKGLMKGLEMLIHDQELASISRKVYTQAKSSKLSEQDIESMKKCPLGFRAEIKKDYTILNRECGKFHLPVIMNGRRFALLVDTGAYHTSLSPTEYMTIRQSGERLEEFSSMEVKINSPIIGLDRNIEVNILNPKYHNFDSVLGREILRDFVIYILGNKMVVSKNIEGLKKFFLEQEGSSK
ncbi:MAG: hypothetical protein ACPGXY_05415 [Alphaproteobacteria bacterium]